MAGSDTLTALACHDIRFPTSHRLDGSDAMHPDPTTLPPTTCSAPPAARRGTAAASP
ncbi:hypothetical protein [Streptomyces kronopolitis]|uniref:hypothetical protein n=1 Tax=Streptomyces kronopolitis TaxID=1612435 RepID=UPI003D99593A